MQNMATREKHTAAPGRRRHWMLHVQPTHVVCRVAGPALAANVVIKSAIAVGDDVETGEFLVTQIAGQRVLVLLAEAAADHGFEKMPGAEIFRVPARPRQRTGDRRRQHNVFSGTKHLIPPSTAQLPGNGATSVPDL